MSNFFNGLLAVTLLSILIPFPKLASATTVFVEVPELTGLYAIEDTSSGQIGTIAQTNVVIPWSGPGPGPRFGFYEISGVLQEPVYIGAPNSTGSEINFNAGYSFQPSRPGVSWGTTLNTSSPGGGTFSYVSDYNASTGQFYFGATIDYFSAYNDACCEAWSGQSQILNPQAAVYARFLTYGASGGSYSDTGAVFIERMRVGLGDSAIDLRSIPMTLLQTADFNGAAPTACTQGCTGTFAVPEITASGATVALATVFALMILLWETLTARKRNLPKTYMSS